MKFLAKCRCDFYQGWGFIWELMILIGFFICFVWCVYCISRGFFLFCELCFMCREFEVICLVSILIFVLYWILFSLFFWRFHGGKALFFSFCSVRYLVENSDTESEHIRRSCPFFLPIYRSWLVTSLIFFSFFFVCLLEFVLVYFVFVCLFIYFVCLLFWFVYLYWVVKDGF